VRTTDRLSGHIVRGVVEGCAVLTSKDAESDAVILRFEAPPELTSSMILKGPIALDGVSLTLKEVSKTAFAVSVVQYTQQHTTVVELPEKARVNVETDILGRYVASAISAQAQRGKGVRLAASRRTMYALLERMRSLAMRAADSPTSAATHG